MKEVRIPRSIVVGEFNVEHIKCRNNLRLYLKQYSKNMQNMEIDVDFEWRAKLELSWSNRKLNPLSNLQFQKHEAVRRSIRSSAMVIRSRFADFGPSH